MTEDLPILVKVWAGEARHEYRVLRRGLASLLASGLPDGARVVLVDDASRDRRVGRLLARLAARDGRVEVWTNPVRLGPDRSHAIHFPRFAARFPRAEFFVLCDDDVVYQPGWLQRLVAVAREGRARGLDGIYTALNVPLRPTRSVWRLPTSEVLVKERQAALQWLLPRTVYEAVGLFRDRGVAFDTDYCDRLAAKGLPVVCLRPSWVQNIGYEGCYQSSDEYRAHDFVGRRGAYLYARDQWWAARRTARAAAGRLARLVRGAPAAPQERPASGALPALARSVRSRRLLA